MILEHAPMHDWYVEGDTSAAFVGDQVLVLSELATSILTVIGADGRASLAEIATALVAQYGDPGVPAEELAREKVLELVEQGVLREVAGDQP